MSTDSRGSPPQSPSSQSTFIPPPSPSTPTDLGASFSSIALSSQEQETPVPKRSYSKKVHGGHFQKGVGLKRKLTFSPTPKKRLTVTSPKSSLFADVQFIRAPVKFPIMMQKDGKRYTQEFTVPSGSQIIDMDILRQVFNLLTCTDRTFTGRLAIYQYAFRDGLQSYLAVKCLTCHIVAIRFPTSLPIGMNPLDAVNDPHMLNRKKSQVNHRALVATHTTSASWNDVRLICHLLGVENSWKTMQPSSQNKFVDTTLEVCKRSMSSAASHVYSTSEPSKIDNNKKCGAVSFDASWHRRGHYSNQGFAAAIEILSGKVLDYVLYERMCNKCIQWTEDLKNHKPEDYSEYWKKHCTECLANYSGSSQYMESAGALEYGEDLWRNTSSPLLPMLEMVTPLLSNGCPRVIHTNLWKL